MRLCFVTGPVAVFTNLPLTQLDGPGWQARPYGQAAGWPDGPVAAFKPVLFDALLETPAERGRDDGLSVIDINAGVCPWLTGHDGLGRQVNVPAGAPISWLVAAVRALGGDALVPTHHPSRSPGAGVISLPEVVEVEWDLELLDAA